MAKERDWSNRGVPMRAAPVPRGGGLPPIQGGPQVTGGPAMIPGPLGDALADVYGVQPMPVRMPMGPMMPMPQNVAAHRMAAPLRQAAPTGGQPWMAPVGPVELPVLPDQDLGTLAGLPIRRW